MAELKFSPDGSYYWTGRYWVRAISPDGLWRWNGSAWVPAQTAAPAPYAPYEQSGTKRVATEWTKPMQYAVAGYEAFTVLYLLAGAYLLSSIMSQYVSDSLKQSAPPSPQLPTVITSFFSFVFWGGAALGIVVCIVVIIGALNRWTWLFYFQLVFYGLSAVGLPFNLIGAVTGSMSSNVYGGSLAFGWLSVAAGILATALFVWMMIAVFRYGPWATVKVRWA